MVLTLRQHLVLPVVCVQEFRGEKKIVENDVKTFSSHAINSDFLQRSKKCVVGDVIYCDFLEMTGGW